MKLRKIEKRIWLLNGYCTIKLTDPVKTFREVRSFCTHNRLRNCIIRAQGGIYKIELNGTLKFVAFSLNQITFQDLFEIVSDKIKIKLKN